MSSPIYVDATDIEIWANRRDSQSRLPQLVRRLVLATASTSRVEFRSGEGVALPGWDGVVHTNEQTAFVPQGLSVWELGTNKSPRAKADEDYSKRSKQPVDDDDIQVPEATFVFVTPRRWPRKSDWQNEKRKDKIFKDVIVLDADDIETWLEQAPAVHLWMSELVGKSSNGTQSIDAFWSDWVDATDPPFDLQLTIAGRDDAVRDVSKRISAEKSPLTIRGDSLEEVLAFVVAVIQSLPQPESDIVRARSIIVDDPYAWKYISRSELPLLLIPTFANVNVGAAIKQGHQVVVPLGREAAPYPETVNLPRPNRQAAKEALVRLGLSEGRAWDLAKAARRSTRALRRSIALVPELQQPGWATPENADSLVPIMLVGKWDRTKQSDQEVIATIVGEPYEQVEKTLTRWANSSDPPVRCVGSTWYVVDRLDAWRLLYRYVVPAHVNKFRQAALAVLGVVDPSLDIPPDQRWTANLTHKDLLHSRTLRIGISETLALMGASPQMIDGRPYDGVAGNVVHDLLGDKGSFELWPSLSEQLPLLAEAAPDTFLTCLNAVIEEPAWLALMFTDSVTSSTLFTTSAHTGLLWAIENLLWSPVHLNSAVLALARLARLDPGGPWNNRPINTLTNMLLPWYPQLSSDPDTGLKIIDLIRANEPNVAWKLMLRLLPGERTHADLLHRPDWRDWAPEPEARMSSSEQTSFLERMTERVLTDGESSPPRLEQLILRMRRLPSQQRARLLEVLSGIEIERLDETVRESIWHSIRVTLSRLTTGSAVSSTPFAEEQKILKGLFHRWTPTDLIAQHAWLFSTRPALPDHDDCDWVTYKHLVSESRANAVNEVMSKGGFAAIQSLAIQSDDPLVVGFSVGQQQILESEDERHILHLLDSDIESERKFGEGFVTGCFADRGWTWAESHLGSGAGRWSVRQQSRFLLGLPSNPRVWHWATSLGDACDAEYWKTWSKWIEDPADCEYAIRSLIKHGRPRLAIRIAAEYIDQEKFAVSATEVVKMLEDAAPAEDTIDSILPTDYEIEVIFDAIHRKNICDNSSIMRLEWLWVPVIIRSNKYQLRIHKELASDPKVFAYIVSLIYRSNNVSANALDRRLKVIADKAYRLLSAWSVVPGAHSDRTVDEAVLADWIYNALTVLAETGHSAIGAEHIGRVLRHASFEEDTVWPPAVLSVIEQNRNNDIDRGFVLEFRNSRGVTTRGLAEGGVQERELAKKLTSVAESLTDTYPRVSALFMHLVHRYEQDASDEDVDAELFEDLW